MANASLYNKVQEELAERKRVEKAMAASEEKYRSIFENTNEAILIAQRDYFMFPNPAALKLFGRSAEELTSQPLYNFIHPEHREIVRGRHMKRQMGEPQPEKYPIKLIHGDEGYRWCELNVVLMGWEGTPAALCFITDNTEKNKLEKQIIQAQRMEAIGRLAGGIVHDFNNLLMGIQGHTSLILHNLDTSHPHYAHLNAIAEYVRSAAGLTKQLLGIAQGGKYEVKQADINRIIEKTLEMYGRAKKEIRIQKYLKKNIAATRVDHDQIEQVLFNLYVNAWQAMPDGGCLSVQTTDVSLQDNFVKPYKLRPGEFIKISVTDNGIGMDENIQQKIFDPFFTTKEKGRGTGLGLASAYGIIKNHNGIITVKSRKGKGTIFDIYLPSFRTELTRESEKEKEVVRGHGTILLVDDEELITNVGNMMLEAIGYKVIIANRGKEALGIYREKSREIDLVILDMIMPDIGGKEVYLALKDINPEIRVLLSSGYSINGQAKDIMDRGCSGFIQKPFDIEELSKKIIEAMVG